MSEQQEADDRRPLVVRRETPAILASYPALERGNQRLHLRLLQYSRSEPTFDIREFVRTPEANYFTKKGIALTRSQLIQLRDVLPQVIEDMDKMIGAVPS